MAAIFSRAKVLDEVIVRLKNAVCNLKAGKGNAVAVIGNQLVIV